MVKKNKDGLFFYPWEKTFERLISPLEEYIEKETTSGLILIFMIIAALVIANSPLRGHYEALLQSRITFSIGSWAFTWSVLHWVNEGLMVFFFFVIGLEIKREVLVGELSEFKGAMLPIFAAIGGMVVPAAFYHLVNPEGGAARGWGIPMATDIAFCISALVFLGRRIPKALTIFLVALAIVDDLGAVFVIALFYTKQIELWALGAAGLLFLVLITLNFSGVRRSVIYLILGVFLWAFMTFSGIHATIAGILVAFCIPARERYEPETFVRRLYLLTSQFEKLSRDRQSMLGDMEQESVIKAFRHELQLAQPLLQRLLNIFHFPVALVIIPMFAFVNGGVALDAVPIREFLSNPITMGVVGGLVLGKCLGITFFSWIAVSAGIASLPKGISLWRHIVGVGFLAGIGFTMSIFISELSFGGAPGLLVLSKTGILLGSLVSAGLGISWIMWATEVRERSGIPDKAGGEGQ